MILRSVVRSDDNEVKLPMLVYFLGEDARTGYGGRCFRPEVGVYTQTGQ